MLCNKRRQADAEVRAVCQNTKQLIVTVPDEAQRESDAEDKGRGSLRYTETHNMETHSQPMTNTH